MNKKIISILTIFSLILTSLTGCNSSKINELISSFNTNSKKSTTPTLAPYYSVTNADTYLEKNIYYNLDVRLPKIVYSEEESDSLIDPINQEIYNNIINEVKKSTENAKVTFDTYMDSAKSNFEAERSKKLDKIKEKYKSVIGSEEVKAIAKILSSGVDKPIISTDSIVEGFTGTEGLIIPGLHNKNIIVKETTETNNDISQTTIAIDGRPGKNRKENLNLVPEESASNNLNIDQAKNETILEETINESIEVNENISNETTNANETAIKNANESQDTNVVEEEVSYDDKVRDFPMIKGKPFLDDNSRFNISTHSEPAMETYDEITLENFYKELKNVEKMRIPGRHMLSRQYVPTDILCTWDVKCLDEDYLSLYIDISETRIESISKRYYYNIDLKNKKIIKINDILGNNYKEKCINSIKNTIDTWSDEKKSALKENYNIDPFINNDVTFFINNNHVPVIVMDKYAITAGAIGYPEFQIK